MDGILKFFGCVVCNDIVKIPIELSCSHIGCKSCVRRLSECPLCFQKTARIAWKSRNDIEDMYKVVLEYQKAFEKGRLLLADKRNTESNATASRPALGVEDTSTALAIANPATIERNESEVVNTCDDTQFDGYSDMYANPHTPMEPYPFDTEPMVKTSKKRSPTQKIPLIDTQFFCAWDTQDQIRGDIGRSPAKSNLTKPSPAKANLNNPSPAKSLNEERLTQSQPLDLTFPEDSEEVTTVPVPYKTRRPGFSPARPLDLSFKTDNALVTSTSTIQIMSDTMTLERDMETPPPVPADVPLDIEVDRSVSRKIRTRASLSETPAQISQKSRASICITPKKCRVSGLTPRNSEGVKVVNLQTPEVERTAAEESYSQFQDDDDQILFEAEDCMNLGINNRLKRRQDNEDNPNHGTTTSDDEFFPLSLPETKRHKANKQIRGKENSARRSTPTPKSVPVVPENESMAEDDDFMFPTWVPPPESLEIENVSPIPKFVFCPTRLHSTQLTKLEELCKLCNGKIHKEFSNEVTHLLLNMDKDGVAYTLKYLMAIAQKKWVLTFTWVEECVKRGQLVPEEPYETSNFNGSDPGVKLSRLSTKNVFDGFDFYVPLDIKTSSVTAADCKQLLMSLGGTILDEMPKTKKRLLIVGDPTHSSAQYKKLYKEMGWLTISWDWILDCVLGYKLVPFSAENILTPEVDGMILSQASVPRPLLYL